MLQLIWVVGGIENQHELKDISWTRPQTFPRNFCNSNSLSHRPPLSRAWCKDLSPASTCIHTRAMTLESPPTPRRTDPHFFACWILGKFHDSLHQDTAFGSLIQSIWTALEFLLMHAFEVFDFLVSNLTRSWLYASVSPCLASILDDWLSHSTKPYTYEDLCLTSSFDWSVKLWRVGAFELQHDQAAVAFLFDRDQDVM